MLQFLPFFTCLDGRLDLLDIVAMAVGIVCRAIDNLSQRGYRRSQFSLWLTHRVQFFTHLFTPMHYPVLECDNFPVPLRELVAHQLYQMVEFGIVCVPVRVDFR